MAQRQIYTVEIDGRQYDIEGDRPPTEAEARAAIGQSAPQPARRLGSAKTGGAANADPNLAPDWGAFVSGAASNLNPMNYIRGIKALLTTDPRESVPAMVAGARDQVGNILSGGTPDGQASRSLGEVSGAVALGPAARGAGRVMRKAAPKVMEMGLQRTMADRLDFPNTPQRLVDEGIVPRGNNVRNAMTTTEQQVTSAAERFDRANPVHRVDPDTIARSARDFAYTEGKVGGLGNVPGPEVSELNALEQDYLARNTRTRSLGETVEQKRAYAARSRYNNRPNAPTQTNEQANFNKGVAAANRAEAIRLEPSLADALAKEQDLLGALVAQEKMAAKGMPNTIIGAGKYVAQHPALMGGASIGLDRTGRALQRVSPELVKAALAQLMASHSQDAER